MDILKCLDKIGNNIFSLREVYSFAGELSANTLRTPT